jgi:hypothetical protein
VAFQSGEYETWKIDVPANHRTAFGEALDKQVRDCFSSECRFLTTSQAVASPVIWS